uniref:Uncharacterized protein n=1 Tax=Plectus sambesii TaxID=2011161 RepID=A0A914VR83_9BILA
MQIINICQKMLEMSPFRLEYCLIASMNFVDDDEDDDNGLHMSDFELETEAPTEDNSDDDGAVNVAFDVEGRAAALARQAEIVQ